jgi:hypothetical protein
MKRITISLPDNVGAAVEREAHRRRISVSQVIRERLEAPADADSRRHIPFAALGRSGRSDTSRTVDTILEREWGIQRAKSDAGGR